MTNVHNAGRWLPCANESGLMISKQSCYPTLVVLSHSYLQQCFYRWMIKNDFNNYWSVLFFLRGSAILALMLRTMRMMMTKPRFIGHGVELHCICLPIRQNSSILVLCLPTWFFFRTHHFHENSVSFVFKTHTGLVFSSMFGLSFLNFMAKTDMLQTSVWLENINQVKQGRLLAVLQHQQKNRSFLHTMGAWLALFASQAFLK